MIEKIDIKDASIAEEIRKNMTVATDSNKGLMSNSHYDLFSIKVVTISSGGTFTISYVCGILGILNKYIEDGLPAIYIVGNNTAKKIGGAGLSGLEILVENNTLSIKNNWTSSAGLSIFYQRIR